jgi:hypothetical protein
MATAATWTISPARSPTTWQLTIRCVPRSTISLQNPSIQLGEDLTGELHRPAFHRTPSLGASAVSDPALTGARLVPRRGIRVRPDILLLVVDLVGSCRSSRPSGG